VKPRDENDRAQAGELPADPATGLRPAPLPRRASSPTPPPAAPTDDLDDAGPPTTPSNRAPASGVVPGGELGAEGDDLDDDGLGEVWRPYGEQVWSQGEPPPRRWLLTRPADNAGEDRSEGGIGYLPRGKVGMVAAAGGAGKTMALLQLGVSVATGRPWLGQHGFTVPPDACGNVCLLLAEEDSEEVQRRLVYIKTTLGIESEEWQLVRKRLFILPFAGTPAQFIESTGERSGTRETEFFSRFKRRLARNTWSLIVLDPLSRLATAETEVDNHHATRFISTIEQLVKMPGEPTVIVAHHTSKAARGGVGAGSANAARGASGLTDGVRWVANLDNSIASDDKSAPPQLGLSLTKHNYNPPAEPRPLVRGFGGVLSVKAPGSPPAENPGKPATDGPSDYAKEKVKKYAR